MMPNFSHHVYNYNINMNKKVLLLGLGVTLIVGGVIVGAVKDGETGPKVGQKPPQSPPPTILPLPKEQKQEIAKDLEPPKSLEMLKVEPEAQKEVMEMVKIEQKPTEITKEEQKKEKRKREKREKQTREKVVSGLAIVCSGRSRECLLYEDAEPYRVGDSFKGVKIEKIEIDGAYLRNGKVISVE